MTYTPPPENMERVDIDRNEIEEKLKKYSDSKLHWTAPGPRDTPNIKRDLKNEYRDYKFRQYAKLGRRSIKEVYQRIKFVSEGLTLDEWTDRVEPWWGDMLEYSEKLWDTFLIYSIKKFPKYPYIHKFYGESRWGGGHWKNWRREEDAIAWQINSRTPFHKHIRLSNDSSFLWKQTKKKGEHTKALETIVGPNRLKLKNQIFTNTARHEMIKQGAYNAEQVETVFFNAWEDSAFMYLKYIKPWLLRLNTLDKRQPLYPSTKIKFENLIDKINVQNNAS